MKVSDARRDGQSIWAEHRRKVQVLNTILDNRHSPGSGSASEGSMTIFAGGALPVSGITGAGRQLSVALCATAGIADSMRPRRGPGRRAYRTWVRFSPLRLSVWKLSHSCIRLIVVCPPERRQVPAEVQFEVAPKAVTDITDLGTPRLRTGHRQG
jgi:hypothetical protein